MFVLARNVPNFHFHVPNVADNKKTALTSVST